MDKKQEVLHSVKMLNYLCNHNFLYTSMYNKLAEHIWVCYLFLEIYL